MKSTHFTLIAIIAFNGLAGCDLRPDPPPEPPVVRGLSVEITPKVLCRGLFMDVDAVICFRNNSPESVWLLKPLDGSSDGRYMPNYTFALIMPDGQEPPSRGKICNVCGLWYQTTWPKDYLVEVKPGTAFELRQGVASQIREPGRFALRFRYAYLPDEHDFLPPG
jgi:hypothetical protein